MTSALAVFMSLLGGCPDLGPALARTIAELPALVDRAVAGALAVRADCLPDEDERTQAAEMWISLLDVHSGSIDLFQRPSRDLLAYGLRRDFDIDVEAAETYAGHVADIAADCDETLGTAVRSLQETWTNLDHFLAILAGRIDRSPAEIDAIVPIDERHDVRAWARHPMRGQLCETGCGHAGTLLCAGCRVVQCASLSSFAFYPRSGCADCCAEHQRVRRRDRRPTAVICTD
jgi:hypothetical protein